MTKKQVTYASFWQRLLAHNIDIIPTLILCYSFSFMIPRSNYDPIWIGWLYILYHILFEASSWQATPGKKWTKLKVTDENHHRLSIWKSLLRNITKTLSLLLFFGGFIYINFNSKRKGFHDYIGGSLVIFEEE